MSPQVRLTSNAKSRVRRGRILKLALFLAALGQDIGHTGFTNAFEVKSNSALAVKYVDDSPLEYYHCALFFKILLKTKIMNKRKKRKAVTTATKSYLQLIIRKSDPKKKTQKAWMKMKK